MARNIQVKEVDKTKLWGNFYGSAQGEPLTCGSRECLFLFESHYFLIKVGSGGRKKQLYQIDGA